MGRFLPQGSHHSDHDDTLPALAPDGSFCPRAGRLFLSSRRTALFVLAPDGSFCPRAGRLFLSSRRTGWSLWSALSLRRRGLLFTWLACLTGKPVPTFPDKPPGRLALKLAELRVRDKMPAPRRRAGRALILPQGSHPNGTVPAHEPGPCCQTPDQVRGVAGIFSFFLTGLFFRSRLFRLWRASAGRRSRRLALKLADINIRGNVRTFPLPLRESGSGVEGLFCHTDLRNSRCAGAGVRKAGTL
jgi:hypothetical protein